MKRILVPIAQGSEELETIGIIDVLRRGKAEVDVVSIDTSKKITCSKGVIIIAEKELKNIPDTNYDLIAIPGGMPGAENIKASEVFTEILKEHNRKGLLIGAICASPAVVLDYHGIVNGRKVTCHPAFRHLLKNAIYDPSPVIVDGNVVTGKGAGHVVAFALKLLEMLFDEETVKEVKKGMAIF